jgi:hypothetical protein
VIDSNIASQGRAADRSIVICRLSRCYEATLGARSRKRLACGAFLVFDVDRAAVLRLLLSDIPRVVLLMTRADFLLRQQHLSID